MKYLITLTALLLLINTAFAGDVYSWEDKDGMHFVDDPSKVPAKYRNQMKSDTDAAWISTNNEFKGYTKNGVKTDKAYKVEMSISELGYKVDGLNCINKFIDGSVESKACIQLAGQRFEQRLQNIPAHIISARKQELSNYHGRAYFDQLGKIKE